MNLASRPGLPAMCGALLRRHHESTMTGMAMAPGGRLGCRSRILSRLTNFLAAASRLVCRPSTSPNQPLSLAS